MGLTRGFTDELKSIAALPVLGAAKDELLNLVIANRLEKHLDVPLRLYANNPADSILNIGPSRVEVGDGASKSVPAVDDSLILFPATTIDFQSGAVVGGTVTTLGQAFTLPATTVGQARRLAFVYKGNGTVDTAWSDAVTGEENLPNPGTVFAKVDGLPIGYIDLVATAANSFKTIGSTFNIIENKVGSIPRIFRFGAGGGAGAGGSDQTYKISSFSSSGCVIKKGYLSIDDGRVLALGDVIVASTDMADLSADLTSVLTASGLDNVGTINAAAAVRLALVIDLTTLGAAVTLTDTLRKVYRWGQGNLRLLASAPEAIDPRRYVLIDEIVLPSGAADFATATAEIKPGRVHDTLASFFPYLEHYGTQLTSEVLSQVLTHNLSGKPQLVVMSYFDGTSEKTLDAGYLVGKDGTNLTVSTMGLTFGAGQYVEMHAFYVPTTQSLAAPSANADSPWYGDTSVTTWAHGLSDIDSVRGVTVQEWDLTAGKRTIIDASALVKNYDGVNVYLDWTGLTPSTNLKYRVSLGSSPVPAVVPQGNFDSITDKSGAGAPNFPNGATGISTGINANPVVKKLAKQAVGVVGSVGQIAGGHVLSSKSFPSALSGNVALRFFNLNAVAGETDGNGSGAVMTPNGAPVYTATNILGAANSAAVLNGTSQYYSSPSSFFNPGNGKSFAVGGWFKASDWTPAVDMSLISQAATATELVFQVDVQTTGIILFRATNSGSVYDASISVPNPGFADGSWHHLAMVYDFSTTTLKAFIDGRLAGSATLANVRASGSPSFEIGAVRAAATNFFAGGVEDLFFVSGYSLTDSDIRKIVSSRFDHNAGIPAGNQKWSANFYGSLTDQGDGPSTWLVDKSDANSLFVDFSDRASTDQVELFCEDRSASPTTVGSVVPFDQIYSTDPAFPLAHSQAGVPEVMLQGEVTAGAWEQLDAQGQVNADSVNLTGSLASFFTAGYLRVRLVARNVGPVQTGVPAATQNLDGLVSASSKGQQRLGGLKVFEGGIASVGNVRAAEGAGTVVLSDLDKRHQVFNLTAAKTVVLPSTSILAGDEWVIENQSAANALTVQSSALVSIVSFVSGRMSLRALKDAPTGVADWLVMPSAPASRVMQGIVSGGQSKVSAYLAANQTGVGTGTDVRIAFDTEEFDTNNEFDATVNKGRFTPTKQGYYLICANMSFSAPTASGQQVNLSIFKNSIRMGGCMQVSGGTANLEPAASVVVFLNGTTDYVECYCTHTVGSAQVILGGVHKTRITITELL